MKHEINIEFNNQEELDSWLEEHVVENTYQGGKVFMIGSFVDLPSGKVTLKSISTTDPEPDEDAYRAYLEEQEQAYIDWQNESQEMMLADYLSSKEEE